MPSAIRGAAVRGIGRFLATMAARSAEERERQRQMEMEAERDLRRSQLEVGQTSLRQLLEQQNLQFREQLPSTVASTRQSTTAADENVARSTLLGAQAAAEPIQTQTENLRAQTAASVETRQGRQLTLDEQKFAAENPDKPAGYQKNLDAWLEESAPLEATGQVVDAYLIGRNTYKLSDNPKDPWYSSAFARTASIYATVQTERLKKEPTSADPETDLVDLGQFGVEAPTTAPAASGAPRRTYPVGRPGAPFPIGAAAAGPAPLGAAPVPSGPMQDYGNVLGASPPAMPRAAPSTETTAIPGVGPRTARLAQQAVDQGKAKSVEEAIDAMRRAGANVSL